MSALDTSVSGDTEIQRVLDSIEWASAVNTMDELSRFIMVSKYARFREDLGRRETWAEAIDRVTEMHHVVLDRRLSEEHIRHLDEVVFPKVYDRSVAPSMRSVQYAGAPIQMHNARIYNCAVRHMDSLRSFAEVFYLLLCGAGVGVGLGKKYIGRMPKLVNNASRTGTILAYTVEDNIEGWADSVQALLGCYFENTPFSGRKIAFDYSKIRAKGEPIKTAGGRAPGYEVLKESHKAIKKLLDRVIEVGGYSRLRPIDAYDIIMFMADAVFVGPRRAAVSAQFDLDDREMMKAKTGDWHDHNPQRARSNNSVRLIRGQVSKEQFEEIAQTAMEWGEPGFIWVDNEDVLYNPCFEIGFKPVTEDGICGAQMCNLTTINVSAVNSPEEFLEAVEAAAVVGTLQAAYTSFPYLGAVAEKLTQQEALLGVSMTGMYDNPKIAFDPELQARAAEIMLEVNAEWADDLGIEHCARAGCLKPEGTGSLVVGTLANGIHAGHAEHMTRRVVVNHQDPAYQYFSKHNPQLCEPYSWSNAGTEDVISFPVKLPEDGIFKDDIGAIQHLKDIHSTQLNWVRKSARPGGKEGVEHNVSCTVIVKSCEFSSVVDYIFDNRADFAAVSFLSYDGDKKYVQAPQEAVRTLEDAMTYKTMVEGFKTVDYTKMFEDSDETALQAEMSCAGGACIV